MATFAFAPEGFAGLGGEGGAVGPGAAVDVGGGQVEAEGGFADAGLAGKNAVCSDIPSPRNLLYIPVLKDPHCCSQCNQQVQHCINYH